MSAGTIIRSIPPGSGGGILRWKRLTRLGFKSLWLHRLRSLLTVLGIVFGVCSVIAMLAIGEGASYEAQERIKNLGSQNIIIRSVKPPEEQKVSEKSSQSFALNYGLTYNDLKRIRSTIPGVILALPARVMREYVWNISRRVDCEIVATVPWYPQMRNHRVARGRFFTDQEMDSAANVCVLGSEMVSGLFPLNTAIGRQVRVGNDYYQVIGIMESQGKLAQGDVEASGGSSRPAAHRMFIPLETAKTRYGELLVKQRSGSMEAERVELHELTVKVATPEEVRPVAEAVKTVLERNHKKKDYEIVVPLELLRESERTKQIFTIVLGSIAAISLLVGGIGIMNIMLASVTERTREIGIRRALGARRRDITHQFLFETVILSASGGILGVLLGISIPILVGRFAGMKTIVTFWSPMLAFSISALVGVVFGLYPALRAAKMDPVEALRRE
jgi:putative ABC transport system permease protein